jgi:hypothetical protein
MIVVALEAIPASRFSVSSVSNNNMAGGRSYEMGTTFSVGPRNDVR